MNTRVNIDRAYRELCLEAVFSEQPLDIAFAKPLPGEESPCIIGSLDDDPRAAIYASLFIAAPDLLAIVKDFASRCPECHGEGRSRGHSWFGPCGACEKLRAVIAKAEGRS